MSFQPSLDVSTGSLEKDTFLQLHHCITDRGSKYSVSIAAVFSKEETKSFLRKVTSAKKYDKATHHSYAVRLSKDGVLFEVKQDDGETGAGMCILRELRRAELTNICVIVTRWYGGVKLNTDRFKHVVDAVKMGLEKLAKLQC